MVMPMYSSAALAEQVPWQQVGPVGAGMGMGMGPMPFSGFSPEVMERYAMVQENLMSHEFMALKQRVDKKYQVFTNRNLRMQADEDLYRLLQFEEEKGFEDEASSQYRTFTSNEPRTYADKIIRMVAQSAVNIKIPQAREMEYQRVTNQAKKDFIMAALKMADRRNQRMLKPTVQRQLAYYATIRGWYAGRALLTRDMMGRTQVDISVWDPISTVFEMDNDGLAWACNMSFMTAAEIQATYPDAMGMGMVDVDSQHEWLVYDYYDRQINAVFADGLELKQFTRHGAMDIPVFLGYAGEVPMQQSGYRATSHIDHLQYVGESCFAANRELYPKYNFISSVLMELVARAREHPYVHESPDGTKYLDKTPFVTGGVARTETGEKIEPLISNMALETPLFVQQIAGELQRGSLPHSSWGELQQAISGYAIQSLRQGTFTQVDPFLSAVQDAMWFISDKLCNQYATGWFMPIAIEGEMDAHAPMLVANASEIDITLAPDIPDDMAAKLGMAEMVRQNPDRLMSDAWIREKVLGVEDEEVQQDLVDAQMGMRMLPAAMSLTMMEALANRGEEGHAMEWLMDYQIQRQRSSMELMGLQIQNALMMLQYQIGMMTGQMPGGSMGPMGGSGDSGGGGEGSREGLAPNLSASVAPQQAMGVPQSNMGVPPNLQGGPNVPPGTPRPGASAATSMPFGG